MEFSECISHLVEFVGHDIIIGGDLNEDLTNPTHNRRKAHLLDFMSDYHFCTSFTEPTFIYSNGKDSTTIDYILVQKSDTLKIGETERLNTLASNTSNHLPVLYSTQCTLIAKKQAVDRSTSISQRIRWKLIDKDMYRAMVDDSLNEAQLKLSSILQVESAVSAIQHIITSAALMCSESRTLGPKKCRKRRF